MDQIELTGLRRTVLVHFGLTNAKTQFRSNFDENGLHLRFLKNAGQSCCSLHYGFFPCHLELGFGKSFANDYICDAVVH